MPTAITTIMRSMHWYNLLDIDSLKIKSKHFHLVKCHKKGWHKEKIHY